MVEKHVLFRVLNPTFWLDAKFPLLGSKCVDTLVRALNATRRERETFEREERTHTLHAQNKKNGSSSFEQTDDSFEVEEPIADSNNSFSRGG